LSACAVTGSYSSASIDFHPENVLLSPSGPVVIDWTNARCGDPPLDVAMTWVIGAASGGTLGRLLTRWYLAEQDLPRVRPALPLAAELRIADPNVTEEESAVSWPATVLSQRLFQSSRAGPWPRASYITYGARHGGVTRTDV
jgi:Phosphotransferase enzyme family